MIRGQDDVRSVYFVIIGWGEKRKEKDKKQTYNIAADVCKCWENPLLPFAGPKQSLCWCVKGPTDSFLLSVGRFPQPSVTCL